KCAVHPEVDASGYCRNCGKPMCAACVRPVRDVLYCEECLAHVIGLPAPQAAQPAGAVDAQFSPTAEPLPVGAKPGPNPALAFLLGLFLPGVGAIYNGEYNKALVQLVIMGGIIVGVASDLGEGVHPLFILALVLFPWYMAIDSLRVAKARATGEKVQDPLELWSKNRPIGPMILIGLGVLFLLSNFGVFEYLRFRQFFWPLVLIGLGFLMLRNRLGGQR